MRILLATALFALIAAVQPVAASGYEVDGSHTFATFKIGHLGMGKVVGTFSTISGNIDLEKGKINIDIKTDSINTHNEKRDQHLKSPDFFNAKQFPVIRFESKEIKAAGDNKYNVNGTLKLHGKTRDVTLVLTKLGGGKDPWGKDRIGVETLFTVSRSDFGMDFMPDAAGDDVEIYVAAQGVR